MWKPKIDVWRVIAVYKTTIISLMFYIMSVADIPQVMPPSIQFCFALYGGLIAILLPLQYFSCLAFIVTFTVWFLTAMLVMTIILAAATVGDGCFVAIFTIITFYIQGLYFGKDFDSTSGLANFIMSFCGITGLSLRPLVQDGFSFSVPISDFVDELKEQLLPVLEQLCQQNSLPSDCWEGQLPDLNGETVSIQIPCDSDTIFACQTAYATVNTSAQTLDVSIPGGLWIVSGLWKWKGLDMPLALWRNLLVFMSWGFALFSAGILLFPPYNSTGRKLLQRKLAPKALTLIAGLVDEKDEKKAEKETDVLIHLVNVIDKGKCAGVTIFEPRILTNPFEFILPKLAGLFVALEKASLGLLFIRDRDAKGGRPMSEDAVKDIKDTLIQCSEALATNSKESIISPEKNEEDPPPEDLKTTYAVVEKVRTASLTWLTVLNEPDPIPGKDKLINPSKRVAIWLVSAFKPHKRLVEMPLVLLRPKDWSLFPVMYAVKRTVGYLILFLLAVYVPEYANYSLHLRPNNVNPCFSGWFILAYSLAFTTTMEGSLKTAFVRELSTIVGCGLAWLGVVISRWSYDEGPSVNAYGITVWLTVMTAILAWISYDPGFAAMVGFSKEGGKLGFLSVVFMDLIAMQVYFGQGSNNELTLNRIVATLTGCALAAIVGVVPPVVRGGDTIHALEYHEAMQNAYRAILRGLTTDEGPETLSDTEGLMETVDVKRRKATMLYKNASGLDWLWKVNPTLGPRLDKMFVTESYLRRFYDVAKGYVEEGPSKNPAVPYELKRLAEEQQTSKSVQAEHLRDSSGVVEKTAVADEIARSEADHGNASSTGSLLVFLAASIQLRLDSENSQQSTDYVQGLAVPKDQLPQEDPRVEDPKAEETQDKEVQYIGSFVEA